MPYHLQYKVSKAIAIISKMIVVHYLRHKWSTNYS